MALQDPFGWVGATLDGQFTVDAVVGEGGFGVVYRGVHLGLDIPVAIKCLSVAPGLPPAQRERLLAKLRAEGKLLHQLSRQTPHIVQALDIGAASSPRGVWTPYLVMEWLDGETLAAALDARLASGLPPRGLDEAITLLSPVAEAIVVAHENHVSHRDLKPANLFCTRSRVSVGLKVLDFGIAKVFAETTAFADARTGTNEKQRAFTPAYAAPEQFTLEYGATGPWTDVFAMALILIEVASNRSVLQGSTVVDYFMAAVEAWKRPDLLAGIASIPPGVDSILRRALLCDPSGRFRNVAEFWSALRLARSAPPEAMLATTRPDASVAETLVAEGPLRDGAGPAAKGPPREARPVEATRHTPPPAATPAFAALSSAGENRVCTVLLADLSNLTTGLAHLDDEELAELTDRARDALTREVERMGGVVSRSGDERVVAVFGIPRATDNDAERAVVAALRVAAARASAAPHRSATPVLLAPSLGITTGRVFARRSGDPGHPELVVTGEAVRVAAALRAAAPAGAIAVAGDAFRQLAGRFNAEPLAPVVVPGRAEPLSCYRITSAIEGSVAFARTDFLGLTTKTVGRGAEIQRMLDTFETVISEGRAQLLTLVGPPGAGRSRLLAELFASLAARPGSVLTLTAQCTPLAADASYSLASALLRQRFRLRPRDGLRRIRRKLRLGLRWLRARDTGEAPALDDNGWMGCATGEESDPADLDAALLPLETLLGGSAGASAAGDSLVPEDSGALLKQRIAAALTRIARFTARRLPIVLLCDDLQWADDASLDLLEGILQSLSDLPLLLVCSARPELLERRPRFGADAATHHRQEIAPLARRHLEEMIKDRLRRVPDLSPDVVRMVAERAEGSPLIVEEMLHLLVDAGAIEARGDDAWVLHEHRLGALRLPATIQGIVQARLDRLDRDLREVLLNAAVVGRTFWQGAVEHLRQAGSAVASSVPVDATLAELRQRGLVRLRDPSSLHGEREMAFTDAAVPEVAYEMLSAKVRRALHFAAATWLERRAETSVSAALLAAQYDRAGDASRAASAYARAAARAMSLGENAEAIRHLERARALHDADEETEREGEHDRRRIAARERLRVRFDLGDALRRVGRLEDAERVYEEARTQIVRVERRTGTRHDPVEALAWEARIDARRALIAKVRGALPEARALVERALARATEAGATSETPAMYALLTYLHRREGRRDESWRAARKGLRLCRTMRRQDERWQEDVAEILLGVALALAARDRTVGAERTYRQVARLAGSAGLQLER